MFVSLVGWMLCGLVAYVALSKSVRKWQGADGEITETDESWLPEIREAGKWMICAAGIFGGAWGAAVIGRTTPGAGTAGSFQYGAPNTPTLSMVVIDTSTVYGLGSSFVGSGDATHDSTQTQIFRVANDMSGAALIDSITGAQIRDTLASNTELKADTTYKIRMRYKANPNKGGWSAWSAPDTFVNNPGPTISSMVTATGQDPDTTWYESLRIDTLPAGATYVDSISGLTICKVTDKDRNSPAAGSYTLAYGNGPGQVSRTWVTGGSRKFSVSVYNSTSNTTRLVEVTKPCTIANWRNGPTGVVDIRFSFSNQPSTPRTAYFTRGDSLHQYDTAGDSVVLAGDFPIAGFGNDGWFQQDYGDSVFVTIENDSAKVFFRKDSTIVRRTVTSFNEPYLDMNGVKVLLQVGGIETSTKYIWNPRAATIDTVTGGTYTAIYHSGNLFDRWPAADVGTGAGHNPHYSLDASAKSTSQHRDDTVGYCGSYHMGGGWKQPDAAEGSQYYSVVWHTSASSGFNNCAGGYGITLWNLDGSAPKWIAHHFNDVDGNNTYWESGFGQQSVDGFAYCFASDQNARGVDPGTDVFCAWLPGA